MNTPSHTQLLEAAEKKFGPLDARVRRDILDLQETEHLEALLGDLRLFRTAEELRCEVAFFKGKTFGFIDGLRAAVDIVLGPREDELADQLSEKAFSCDDAEELERLLQLAGVPVSHPAPSTN